MRRVLVVLAVCAVGSFALSASAQAAGSSAASGAVSGGVGLNTTLPAAKAPKPKQYEWCGSASGCGFVYDLYPKTLTWVETIEGFEGATGTYTKGAKGLLVLVVNGLPCVVELHKVKKTKNYAGAETGPEPCFNQTVELIKL